MGKKIIFKFFIASLFIISCSKKDDPAKKEDSTKNSIVIQAGITNTNINSYSYNPILNLSFVITDYYISKMIDINNDNTNEFEIYYHKLLTPSGQFISAISIKDSTYQIAITNDGQYPLFLNYKDSIGSNLKWKSKQQKEINLNNLTSSDISANFQDPLFYYSESYPSIWTNTSGYIGIRKKSGTIAFLYGWLHVRVTNNSTEVKIELLDYGIEK